MGEKGGVKAGRGKAEGQKKGVVGAEQGAKGGVKAGRGRAAGKRRGSSGGIGMGRD